MSSRPSSVAAVVAFALSAGAAFAACSPSATTATGETCADCTDASADGSTHFPVGTDSVVTGFEATLFSFTGSENRRTNDLTAAFPPAAAFDNITMTLTLACPSGKCDAWDRAGTVGVVIDEDGVGGDDEQVIEIARFMTPYGVGGTWTYDLTDLAPILRGPVKLRGFIDTWVGPGSSYGNGWALTTTFAFHGGTLERTPIAVIPIWQHGADSALVVGDSQKPLSASLPDQTRTLRAPASSVSLRTIITGHGQGNAGNCAEFCKLEHTTTLSTTGGTSSVNKVTPWRNDCRTTAVAGQQGTWTLSRAGWCPGADVRAWNYDVTGLSAAALAGREPIVVHHGVAAYDNTCREMPTDSGTCNQATCSLGTPCAYDGGNHTEPFFRLSTVMITYR